jgi:hypothetical protein
MANGADIRRQLMADLNRDYLAYLGPINSSGDTCIRPLSEQALQSDSKPLTTREKDILAAGGARLRGFQGAHIAEIAQSHLKQLRDEIGAIIQRALIAKEASQRLSIPLEMVRELVTKEPPVLFAFEAPNGILLFPRWQFTDQGTLPHLSEVLNRTGPEVTALAVHRFMTGKHPDLQFRNSSLSPRDWLDSGQDPDEVLMLASDL